MEALYRRIENQQPRRYSEPLLPTRFKMRVTLVVGILICVSIILISYFCPAFYCRCPNCEYTPTVYEARHTNFCPECGTSYNENAICSNCGEECNTPFCPYCGAENKEDA